MSETADAFHDHLDICQQCREHPFQLCSVGTDILRSAATACPVCGLVGCDSCPDEPYSGYGGVGYPRA